jgi:hypothetical protein
MKNREMGICLSLSLLPIFSSSSHLPSSFTSPSSSSPLVDLRHASSFRKAFKTHSRRSPKRARGVSMKANICTVVDVEFAISRDVLTISFMSCIRNRYCLAPDLYCSLTRRREAIVCQCLRHALFCSCTGMSYSLSEHYLGAY